jgi:hypothetical protein
MGTSHKYKWILIFGVVVSAAMLLCAAYIKDIPLWPFLLLDWLILLALGHGFSRASGKLRKVLGRYSLWFLAIFMASGWAALILNPKIL